MKQRPMVHTCCPLSFSNIGPPLLPVSLAFPVFLEPLLLLAEVVLVLDEDHDDGCVSGRVFVSAAGVSTRNQVGAGVGIVQTKLCVGIQYSTIYT